MTSLVLLRRRAGGITARIPLARRPRALLLFTAIAFVGCLPQDGTVDPDELDARLPGTTYPASMVLAPTTDTLVVGASVQLTAVIRDGNGGVMSSSPSWSSSATTATVSPTGLVVARARGGAVITAQVKGRTGWIRGRADILIESAPAPLPNPVTDVDVSPSGLNLTVGGSSTLTATASDGSGNPVAGTTFVWRSSNDSIATVSPGGTVTARGIGSALIIAALVCCDEGPADSSSVQVSGPTSNPPNTPGLAVTNITAVAATLNGSAFSDSDAGNTHTASEWQVDEQGSNWSTLVANSGVSTTNLTVFAAVGLIASTNYQAHVRYRDNNNAWSPWSTTQSFATSAAGNSAPNTPTLSTSNITSTSATLSGNPFSDPDAGNTHGASEWQVDEQGGNWLTLVATSGATTTNLISFPAVGLAASTAYQARVRYRDNNGAFSAFSAAQTFTTTAGGSPPPPPPAGALTGWFSDWATQTPNLGHIDFPDQAAVDRLADLLSGALRWNSGVSRRVHGEVVTAPAGAPFAKWVEVEFQSLANSGQFEIIKSNLPVIGADQVQTWRWYETYEQPGNTGATNNHHGIGAKFPGGGELWTQDASYDTSNESRWVDFFAIPGEGGGVNRKWGVWPNASTSQGNNNYAGQYRYTKGALYMKVVQIRRIGSTGTFRMKIWTYTVDPVTRVHTLLHGPADYRNENGSLSLADNPVLTASDINLTSSFTIGSNGISGTFGTPLPFMHFGGVAVVFGQVAEGTPIGPYGTVVGEVPR